MTAIGIAILRGIESSSVAYGYAIASAVVKVH
jgi:hypothetical protein